jgi:outer membrane protein OmpA-like peptidoglycan-associated protein
MFADPLESMSALLLTNCTSIHTAFMRQSIDVLYLDTHGVILRCVADVRPWRVSACPRARHVLEMAAGSIARLAIVPGHRLAHPFFKNPPPIPPTPQHGASMTEFIIVAPVLLLIGLALLQYALLFFTKNQVNHAAFMAVRAGSMHNATAESISTAYLRHLAPLYGGGSNVAEVAESAARAAVDMQGNYRLELINPTRASFDDFSEPALKEKHNTSARVLPNSSLPLRDPSVIKANSAQNIFDANLIKVRITHGYRPGVPLVAKVFATGLQAADDGQDSFVSALLAKGRVPVVTEITLHMNSDAFEWSNPVWISPEGARPANPAGPPGASNPPGAQPPTSPDPPGSKGSGDTSAPPTPGNDVPASGNDDANTPGHTPLDSGTACGGAPCPVCNAYVPASEEMDLPSDVLFDFDQSTLKQEGREELDSLIEEARAAVEDGEPIAGLTISGYTDQLGSDAVNLKLSQARAEAVRDYLKANGFPDVPVTVRGMGAAEPKVPLSSCSGSPEEQRDCLAPNRRVVIEVRRAGKA